MTQASLQAFLVKDLKECLKDCKYSNNSGVETSLNVFFQDLPNDNKYEETPITDNFPFVVVEIPSGAINTADEAHKVAVNFVIGTVEPNGAQNGHLDVFAIINKILAYLSEKSIFNKRFNLDYPLKWSVKPDETAEPYFYGLVESSFLVPSITEYRSNKNNENTNTE